MVDKSKKKAKYGTIFLGKDEKTYGKEGTGHVDYDPEFECGGPEGTPGRQCAFETKEHHTAGLSVAGSEDRQLHISIASFRDPLCPKTLYNLFTKAKHPEKLRVRVLEQSVLGVDVDCLKTYCDLILEDKRKEEGDIFIEDSMKDCEHADQIIIHHLDAAEAAGPTWARGMLSADMEVDYRNGIVNTQDHCMSIDSHMDVEPEWDQKMVSMWDDAKNEYAVLSTYVVDVAHLGKTDIDVPHLCMVTFTSNVRTHATKCANNLSKPKLTNAIWGAGLSFSKCHAELKVMVDPHTPQVFDGEEFNRAARFFTYGYDIYTPNAYYVLHDYHKSQSNPIQSSWDRGGGKPGSLSESNFRLKTMIDVPGGSTDPVEVLKLKQSKYGLGDRRSLDQLIQFSGIDLRHKRPSIDGKNRCGNIQWEPFLEHPNGVNYIPKFNDTTEDPLDIPYKKDSVWYDFKKDAEALTNQDQIGKEKDDVSDGVDVPRDNNLQKEHAKLLKEIEAAERNESDGEGFIPERNMQKKHAELLKEIESAERNESDAAGFIPERMNLQKKHAELSEKLEASKKDKTDALSPNDINLLDNNIIRKQTEVVKQNLRRRVKDKLFSSIDSKIVRGFLVNHSIISPDQHGFQQLPGPVQISVVVLIIGFVISVVATAGKGRAYIRKTRTA
mmetsp:Transcript_13920/g.16390  ORF Transcript_13920/g.16390 Transcript_13920/m.16390 type:complete len:666 (-) Transcript_13920:117-2114(-)